MSTIDEGPSETAIDIPENEAPAGLDTAIELDQAYDDQADPSTVTVFPADAEWPEIGTTWISVDVEHAVPVSNYR